MIESIVSPQVDEVVQDEHVEAHEEASVAVRGVRRDVPLNRLRRSANNVRKKRNAQSIPELAALIEFHGLLAPLCITEGGDGWFDVEAGGRRLEACELLASRGVFAEDELIECKLYPSREAVQISMAENSGREEMHPADQFEAFAKVIADEGLTPLQLANRFGVSQLTVERRLLLANLEPRFLDLYREGEADLAQLQALSLTRDRNRQVAVWESLSSYQRTPYMLKQALTETDVRSNNRVARFVGLDAYSAAGGDIRRDLFDEGNECWLEDQELLLKLAMARLEIVAEGERASGWAWVEIHTSISHDFLHSFTREQPKARPMTEDEADGMADWVELVDEASETIRALAQQYDDEEEGSESQAQLVDRLDEAEDTAVVLREIVALLRSTLNQWSAKQLSTCGVVITIDGDGDIEIVRGLMRAQERKALVAELKKSGKTVPAHLQAARGASGARNEFSERLMLDMTAHRTAALQAVLLKTPHVALALVVHKMAQTLFGELRYRYVDSPLKVAVSLTRNTALDARASEYKESAASAALHQAHAHWESLVPDAEGELFGWLLDQDDATLMSLLAFCAANTLDAMHGQPRTSRDTADALADALELDMADWWAPTPAKYLDSVSKAQLVAAVTEACGAEAAKPIVDMKKAAAVAYCTKMLDGKRWLPAPFRRNVPHAA